MSFFPNVGAVGEAEDAQDVLLDQQDREPVAVELAKIALAYDGRQLQPGLVEIG